MQLSTGTKRVLVIPDLQCPFEHADSVPFLKAVAKRYRTDTVVCIGDSMDFHAMSRWSPDPSGYGPAEEYSRGIKSMKAVYAAFPNAVEVVSNHNARVAKRVFDAGIPEQFVKGYEELMQYPPGWSVAECVEIDGVVYEHGHTQGGENAAKVLAKHNGQSTVIGHHHTHAGVQYMANRNHMIWGMNAGCLVDIDAYAFRYAREQKFKPTLGCGVVICGVPHFIPMLIDEEKRWTKRLMV